MPRKKDREYVIDSYALLQFLQKQRGWQEIGQLLRSWKRERRHAWLNWVNWGEIYYTVRRTYGSEKADATMNLLTAFPIMLAPIDLELVRDASEIKADHRLSFADAFCAATAIRYKAILVTGDPEFASLESQIDIRWV